MHIQLHFQAYMCTKDLRDSSSHFAISYSDLCTSNAFSDVPVSSEKGGGPAVQRVAEHAAFLYGPFGQYCQPATKYATEVKFPIRQDVLRVLAYGVIVLLRPAFLKGDNCGRWINGSNFNTNLGEAVGA